MESIPRDWLAAAVAITPGFEVSGDPYLGVSGDFDDMGISCGALQWNIGSNSLQPMVRAVGQGQVLASMPVFGTQIWTACNAGIARGLAIVRAWQTESRLKPAVKQELRNLMGSEAMRAEQDKKIDAVARIAFQAARDWATSAGTPGGPSKRGFCWFFDLTTQNGGLEGVHFGDVRAFIVASGPDRADDIVCNFLESLSGTSGHVRDAKKNAAAWRNKPHDEMLELLVLSYLRSNTARPQWRHVVLNRKGAVAMGGGWVNSTSYDFSRLEL